MFLSFSNRKKYGRKKCGLVLSLSFLGWLVSRIPSQQSLGFGTLEGVVSKITNRRGLGLGHGSVSKAITLWATLIHLSEDGRILKLSIICWLMIPNYLTSSHVVTSELGLKFFLKKIEWDWTLLKLCQYQTQRGKIGDEVRRPILNFFLLVLRVLFNPTLDNIPKSLCIAKTSLKESFELNQGEGALSTWLRRSCKLILPQRNKAANGIWLEPIVSAVYIEVIFILHGTFSMVYRLRITWSEPGGTNLCKTLSLSGDHCSEVSLGVLGGSRCSFFEVSKLI